MNGSFSIISSLHSDFEHHTNSWYARLLWYTTSLKVLEIQSEKADVLIRPNYYGEPRLIRDTVPLVLYHGIDFSACSNLKAITFRGFAVSEFDLVMILKTAKNLKALSFIGGEFIYNIGSGKAMHTLGSSMAYLAIRDSHVKIRFSNLSKTSAFFDLCARLKVIDLRACDYTSYLDTEKVKTELKELFPQADVLVDKNEYYEFDLND